jgi:hypothetical protein
MEVWRATGHLMKLRNYIIFRCDSGNIKKFLAFIDTLYLGLGSLKTKEPIRQDE